MAHPPTHEPQLPPRRHSLQTRFSRPQLPHRSRSHTKDTTMTHAPSSSSPSSSPLTRLKRSLSRKLNPSRVDPASSSTKSRSLPSPSIDTHPRESCHPLSPGSPPWTTHPASDLMNPCTDSLHILTTTATIITSRTIQPTLAQQSLPSPVSDSDLYPIMEHIQEPLLKTIPEDEVPKKGKLRRWQSQSSAKLKMWLHLDHTHHGQGKERRKTSTGSLQTWSSTSSRSSSISTVSLQGSALVNPHNPLPPATQVIKPTLPVIEEGHRTHRHPRPHHRNSLLDRSARQPTRIPPRSSSLPRSFGAQPSTRRPSLLSPMDPQIESKDKTNSVLINTANGDNTLPSIADSDPALGSIDSMEDSCSSRRSSVSSLSTSCSSSVACSCSCPEVCSLASPLPDSIDPSKSDTSAISSALVQDDIVVVKIPLQTAEIVATHGESTKTCLSKDTPEIILGLLTFDDEEALDRAASQAGFSLTSDSFASEDGSVLEMEVDRLCVASSPCFMADEDMISLLDLDAQECASVEISCTLEEKEEGKEDKEEEKEEEKKGEEEEKVEAVLLPVVGAGMARDVEYPVLVKSTSDEQVPRGLEGEGLKVHVSIVEGSLDELTLSLALADSATAAPAPETAFLSSPADIDLVLTSKQGSPPEATVEPSKGILVEDFVVPEAPLSRSQGKVMTMLCKMYPESSGRWQQPIHAAWSRSSLALSRAILPSSEYTTQENNDDE